MLRNGFIWQGGGELANIGWNQIYPAKRQKMFRKMFEPFFKQKCSDGDEHFFNNFFQSNRKYPEDCRVVQSVHTRY